MNDTYKKFLDDLIGIVAKEGASDLHISEGRNPIIRVSGFLVPLLTVRVLTREDMNGLMGELISAENLKIFAATKEVDFSYNHAESRFRGNGFVREGKSAV